MDVLKENCAVIVDENETSKKDLSVRTYAVIEAECNELEHIIELLGQFFPKTKILECNSSTHALESNCSKSTCDNELRPPQTFKGKVKDYLQRRYLEQTNEYSPRRTNLPLLDLSSSSSLHKPSLRLKLNSFEDNGNDSSSQTKQRSSTTDTDPLTFSFDEQSPTNHSHQQKTKPTHISLPPTPFSASSDPGPFRSPWLQTPTSSFNFRFPQSQEPAIANAQGSIAQLSTLTKILCDEPSVFTPTSPRFHSSSGSSPPKLFCQVCRQEFESHQMYLTHYCLHLTSTTGHDDKTDSNTHCEHSSDLRHNYFCQICSKRFSRSDMLNRHLRLHSGIRPYRCTLCQTQFSRSDHLSTHLRTHTGEKPYTCPQCSYTACRRDMITRHLKIHTKQRSERKYATSTFTSSNDP